MFMYYCGQKGSKFGELKNSLKQQQKCLEVEKTMLKIKIFLGGHAPKPPYIRAAAKAARGTCLRHVQSDHYWYYIIFRFFLCYSVSCLKTVAAILKTDLTTGGASYKYPNDSNRWQYQFLVTIQHFLHWHLQYWRDHFCFLQFCKW